jgi:hypothetical protein
MRSQICVPPPRHTQAPFETPIRRRSGLMLGHCRRPSGGGFPSLNVGLWLDSDLPCMSEVGPEWLYVRTSERQYNEAASVLA